MKKQRVCILGGTGFVGKHLVNRLADQGWRVRVLTRRRERHRELLVLPTIDVIEANIHDDAVLHEQFAGIGVVINLVGILNESRRDAFRKIHVDLPRRIVAACQEQGVSRLLHMSALHADAQAGKSRYQRSKGEGENAVHAAGNGLHVTSFRPSIIFGPGDNFFNRFAALVKLAPGVLPLACPGARFAPVYVGDVVTAFVKSIDDKRTFGQRYNLCGLATYTLQELLEFTAITTRRRCAILGLGNGLSALQARVMGLLPGKPLTYDNYLSMQVDSVCNGPFPEVFGVTPASIEAIVPKYLAKKGDPFDDVRHHSRHDE